MKDATSEPSAQGLEAAEQPLSVDICVCTFRRDSIVDTLRSLDAMSTPEPWRVRIIVADNDETPSAQPLIEDTAARMTLPVVYVHAPSRNISIARNACLDAADANWVAFIDDDEVAEPGWIAHLIDEAIEQEADAVFGPAIAGYPENAPAWMRKNDFHSNRPTSRGAVTETGYSSNVAIRWRGALAEDERFLLSLGRTGGEDVEYFFRLYRKGCRLGPAERAVVHEPVAARRLTLNWLMQRKFTLGRIYGCNKPNGKLLGRMKLFGVGVLKSGYCLLRAGLTAYSAERGGYWAMRCLFHAGVCAGCLSPPSTEFYGGDKPA